MSLFLGRRQSGGALTGLDGLELRFLGLTSGPSRRTVQDHNCKSELVLFHCDTTIPLRFGGSAV